MQGDLLSSIGICVAAAALLALVGNRFRQPLILAYLLTGVLIGPVFLNLVPNRESIQTVAEIGLILLLFIIGLEIDLKKLWAAGRAVILTGALQVPICIVLGAAFFYLLGFEHRGGPLALAYLAATMSMSSTLIVVKLLYDKFELDTLPGRITLGVLVFQDLWAVAMLAVQPNLQNPNLVPLLASLLKGAALIIWSLAVSRYILPRLFRAVAKVPELVLVSALAWCFFLAFAASAVGLSREMGALIAGVSLSTFPYNLDVIAKVTSIRDFFVTLFFVALGMQLRVPSLDVVLYALAAATFVMLSRVVVVPLLMAVGLGHRASLLPAINLANISEFSIVIASLGLAYHHVDDTVVLIVIITFAITAVSSTYLVGYSHPVYDRLSWLLKRLRVPDLDRLRPAPAGADGEAHRQEKPVVFLGFFRDASSVLQEFELRKVRHANQSHRHPLLDQVLVIDFNPQVIAELRRRGITCVYGDIAHLDTLQRARIEAAELVVSTITDDILRGTSNLRLMRNVRRLCPGAAVILTSEHIKQALEFYAAGAEYVYIPRLHSAHEMAHVIEVGLRRGFEQLRREELDRLRTRNEVLA
ncbi:MAG TPA: cation:proton antiporter [Candidatus Acidoferrales bacterium]|nr:cation:proton antiporter [Candidatus Acidoferrales bacterium]